MRLLLVITVTLIGLSNNIAAQSLNGTPQVQITTDTSATLSLKTDTTSIVTVHVATDTTYRNAFVFLGRTTGADNTATIKMDGLKARKQYYYQLFLGLTPAYKGRFNLNR